MLVSLSDSHIYKPTVNELETSSIAADGGAAVARGTVGAHGSEECEADERNAMPAAHNRNIEDEPGVD
jgi:hypothetical protein